MVAEMAATTEVAAMIDPLLAPQSRRPAQVRPPKRKRAKPARTSKIFTAGASATALFSMVAAMGWQSGTSSANSADATLPIDTTPPVALVVPVAPPTTAAGPAPVSVAPVVVAVAAATIPVVVPAATIPVVVPVVTPAPIVVPKAVTVPKAVAVAKLPVQKVTKKKSHTATKTSG
jgi:hypothetical protein